MDIAKYDEEVINFMVNREWEKDEFSKRKLFLLNIAMDCEQSDKTSDVIGGLLLFNQIIEQLLKEVIVISIGYLKAEIWPARVNINYDYERMNFGRLIQTFKEIAIVEDNRDSIIEHLEIVKKIRNSAVHKLFYVDNIGELKLEIKSSFGRYYELFSLLGEYYDQISRELYVLYERVDFESFRQE